MSRGKARGQVREASTGEILPCCWMPCWNPGKDHIRARVRETRPEDGFRYIVRYIFCSERCKAYWVNSVRDMENLPTGMKGTLL